MLNSLSKVWSEVVDESTNGSEGRSSVRFSPSATGEEARRRTEHYIHYEKRPLERVRLGGNSHRRGSPRILKPVNDSRRLHTQSGSQGQQKSKGIWGALGKLGKVLKGGDDELSGMKQYMNGMISETKPVRSRETAPVKRPLDLGKSRLESMKLRAEKINERAARFTSENLSPQKKRQRVSSVPEPLPMRRLRMKDLEDLESSRDHFVEKVQRRTVSNPTPTTRHQSPPAMKNPSSTLMKPVSSATKSTVAFKDIPSSPFREETPTGRDTVNVSQNTLTQLTKKLELLENTVDSLKEELKASNERSQLLEETLNEVKREHDSRIENTILNSEEMEKIELFEPYKKDASTPLPPTTQQQEKRKSTLSNSISRETLQREQAQDNDEDDEFEEVNRSLSPVKLDLHKFKYVQ